MFEQLTKREQVALGIMQILVQMSVPQVSEAGDKGEMSLPQLKEKAKAQWNTAFVYADAMLEVNKEENDAITAKLNERT